jgi:RHH-type proline utilization regulon transcriptional repressor/proline dehydrogenase/delta 1-pyrroline-5-carboxylate dehydrogenase
VAQAERAVGVAKAAFSAWRDTEPAKRADYLFRAADVMRRRRIELAAWEVYECGKPWREADADVAEAIDYCDYYGREMLRLAEPRHMDVPGEENVYFYEPRGVVVVIAPWNFPLAILCGMTTAALVTGNTVIMKPAEPSSVIGAKLMEVFQEVGMPPGVAAYLPGVGEEVGPVLVNHPHVDMIAFTGSRGVGLLLNRQAADMAPGQDHVKRVLAEMGGKNAIIVDDDADMDEAVRGVVASAFGYQGQKCSACSRVIVPEPLHDAFVHRLVEATRSLKIAPAEDPGSAVGPVIDEEAFHRIRAAIEQGKAEGRLVYAGDVGALAGEGYYVAPHVFTDVAPTARLAQEEIFGPVLAVLRCRDLTHALEIANGTPYALTGGLFSRSPEHVARVKREFRVGNLYINRRITGALVDRQPFGGFKMSGIGSKAGGPDYLLQFVLPRTITENTMRRGFAPAAEVPGP